MRDLVNDLADSITTTLLEVLPLAIPVLVGIVAMNIGVRAFTEYLMRKNRAGEIDLGDDEPATPRVNETSDGTTLNGSPAETRRELPAWRRWF